MRTIEIQSEKTASRYDELASYCESNLLSSDRTFCCASADACRQSIRGDWKLHEGQCSYLGEHYEALDDGHPMRILVVAMQTGRPNVGVDLQKRRLQVHRSRDKPYSGSDSRNAHMKGVTTALKVLWGIDPTSGSEGELLATNRGQVHLFDTFAMANATLCSRVKVGSAKGQGTKVMLDRCSKHLRETIRILEPTIIHSQGRQKAGRCTHTSVEAACDEIDWIDDYVARVRIGDVRAVWVSLRHPSMQWGKQHLKDVVIPALERARSLSRSQECPVCGTPVRHVARHPRYLCESCASQATGR
jgi:hypothetical protein